MAGQSGIQALLSWRPSGSGLVLDGVTHGAPYYVGRLNLIGLAKLYHFFSRRQGPGHAYAWLSFSLVI